MARLRVDTYDCLLDRLEVDIRRIEPRYVGPPKRILPDGTAEDYWGIRSRVMQTAHGAYEMYTQTAVGSAKTLKDLERHSWPHPDIFDYSVMAQQRQAFPDHAILYEGSDLFTRPAILRGMENLMMDMVERPEMAHYILEKFTAFYCEDLTRALEATDGSFHLYCEWSDYGTQEDLLISVPMFREFAAPYLKRLIDVCHGGGVKFMLHSCGAIRKLIPDFLDLGVDILDPIQVSAKGMNPRELKQEFGDRLSFHGGLDVQTTLPFGTVDDVRWAVQDRIRTLGRGGGYILAPSHSIQPDTPLDNILALYELPLREYPR
jgi:uroporphyrinogen decarboxylase